MKVYIAGPISGQSYDQVAQRYANQVSALEDMGYEAYYPMIGKGQLRTELEFKAKGYDGCPVASNHAIKERDRWMVGQADILLMDFTESGDRVSIGSCMELAWGDELRKQCIVVMQEDNIHQHAFILECADIVFNNMDDAMEYMRQLITRSVD